MIIKRKILKYAFFILLVVTSGCSDKSKVLLDQIDIVSLVNPGIRLILQDAGIQEAYLTQDNEIVVITGNNLFFSNDLFQNLSFHPIGFINYTLTPTVNKQYVIFQNIYFALNVQVFNKQGTVTSINITKSNNWYSINNPVNNPGILRDAAFLSEKMGWFLNNKSDGKLILEKYSDNGSQEIYQFHSNDGRIKFYDDSYGYIFLPYWYFNSYYVNPGNVYMAVTSDGGLSWSTPRLIGVDIRIWDLQLLSKYSLTIKPKYDSNDFLFTNDGGLTWIKVIIPSGYILEQIISGDLSLVKKNNSFYIYDATSNTIVSNIPSPIVNQSWLAKGYFISSDTGIIYTESELYITFNKGQSWKMLVYPFNYLDPM